MHGSSCFVLLLVALSSLSSTCAVPEAEKRKETTRGIFARLQRQLRATQLAASATFRRRQMAIPEGGWVGGRQGGGVEEEMGTGRSVEGHLLCVK